jgi:serine phosphatase RsbU (regulator of sigma subunit)
VIRFIRIGLITGAILITVLDIAGISRLPDTPYTGIRHTNLVFQELEEESPNHDLQLERGDEIIAVDGVTVRNLNHFRFLTEYGSPEGSQIYTVARGYSVLEMSVELTTLPAKKVYRRLAYSLAAFAFIFLGLVVIIRRPDQLGFLFTVNCLIIAFLLTIRPVTSVPFLHLAGELAYDFLMVFFPAFFVHFFLIFPGKEIVSGSRRYLIRKILYIPPTLIFLALFVVAMMRYSSGIERGIVLALNGLTSIYWLLYILASIFFFIRTYITSDRVQRVKFRISTFGLTIGVLPMLLVMLVRNFFPGVEIPFEQVSGLFLSFISASFAYAILRHDAFDLRFVFGAGIALVLILAVLSLALFIFGGLTDEKYNAFQNVNFYFIGFFAVVFVIAAFVPARTSLLGMIDRIFNTNRKIFREKVMEFSRSIQSHGTIEQMTEFVTYTLRDLFDARYAMLFLGGGKNFSMAGSSPEGIGIPLTSLPGDTGLINLAREKKLPLMVEYYDRIWINSNLDRTSREFLSLSDASVIVPLVEQGELLGFAVLGRKLSGRPYGRIDAEILELLGERSAAAVRNKLLYRETMEKEKLEEEVHLASEIQQRLLPSSPPIMKSAEILGEMRTSREVGGDFYDYLELAPGVTGFAVADVSGKGIPASLLMTTLQTGFRSEARVDVAPAEVLGALNRLLYDRSELSRFATFFYGVYEDKTGILRYSNGGAFPPIVIRADGGITKLQRGGTLIGVDPDSSFNNGVLKLRSGDLLISYTDGFIDQESGTGDYFGEERIISFLKANMTLPLDELMEKLFKDVLAFGDGNVMDDTTAVMLRVL